MEMFGKSPTESVCDLIMLASLSCSKLISLRLDILAHVVKTSLVGILARMRSHCIFVTIRHGEAVLCRCFIRSMPMAQGSRWWDNSAGLVDLGFLPECLPRFLEQWFCLRAQAKGKKPTLKIATSIGSCLRKKTV